MSIGDRDFITTEEIAKALGGRRHAGYWMAKCPSHDDRVPSLCFAMATMDSRSFTVMPDAASTKFSTHFARRGLWPDRGEKRQWRPPPIRPKPQRSEPDNSIFAARVWRESVDSKGTWAEDYLASRNLNLPDDPEIRCRTLRFHPRCLFPDKQIGPALIAAFTTIVPAFPTTRSMIRQ